MKFRKLGIAIKNQKLYIEDIGEANAEMLKKRVAELLRRDEGINELFSGLRRNR